MSPRLLTKKEFEKERYTFPKLELLGLVMHRQPITLSGKDPMSSGFLKNWEKLFKLQLYTSEFVNQPNSYIYWKLCYWGIPSNQPKQCLILCMYAYIVNIWKKQHIQDKETKN